MNLNVFRVLADLAHISSKCILIWAIHRNSSSEGMELQPLLLHILPRVSVKLTLLTRRIAPHTDFVRFCFPDQISRPLPSLAMDIRPRIQRIL